MNITVSSVDYIRSIAEFEARIGELSAAISVSETPRVANISLSLSNSHLWSGRLPSQYQHADPDGKAAMRSALTAAAQDVVEGIEVSWELVTKILEAAWGAIKEAQTAPGAAEMPIIQDEGYLPTTQEEGVV